MVEKAIRIRNADEGDYVATRDANEDTGTGISRTVQLVDFSSRQLDAVALRGDPDTPTRISAADTGVNLSGGVPTGVVMLDVGDKSTLVVHVHHDIDSGEATLTPLVAYDYDGGTQYGVLEAKKTASASSTAIQYGANNYISPALAWDCRGAKQIGILVSELGAGDDIIVYGGLI